MKKVLCVGIVLILCCSLFGCGDDNASFAPVSTAPSTSKSSNHQPSDEYSNKINTPVNEGYTDSSSESQQLYNDGVQVVSTKLVKDVGNSGVVVYLSELKNVSAATIHFDDVSIDLFDIDGNIISTDKLASISPATLNPGESAYICEGLLTEDVPNEQIGTPEIHYSVEKLTKYRECDMEFTPGELEYDSSWGTSMLGQLTNTGSSDYDKDVFVVIPVKNSKGEMVTVLRGSVDGLKAGETKGVDANDGLLLMGTIPEECTYSQIVCTHGDYR
ncbi:hypothetical protein LQE92_08820 [Lacrimispora sp. NSJ-141]|uniref:Uncharacterized protein n=1 Tax=Lientehia hominis TaxID=2897778 RepID=A0AAP2WA72_9FIRM|nr:hypothetical protein [Lientehia hominis]MCD2492729.1 hypothetical protein [Lientehia hominis]